MRLTTEQITDAITVATEAAAARGDEAPGPAPAEVNDLRRHLEALAPELRAELFVVARWGEIPPRQASLETFAAEAAEARARDGEIVERLMRDDWLAEYLAKGLVIVTPLLDEF